MSPRATISEMTAILIVDDHPAFRQQARALLEAEGMQIVGEAADGPSALAAFQSLGPQVVLLDIGLPGADGFAVAEQLAKEPSPPLVVLISSREASTYGSRIGASPVVGFIQKDELSAALLQRILNIG
jgi:DNA-binding NarL/FixJ family response regulator